ncbi:MAG: acyl transferase [Ferruginibacter sp.]
MTVPNDDIIKSIFNITPDGFEETSLNLFRYQYEHNKIYRQYCDALKIDMEIIKSLKEIPFLPIQFFKTKKVCTTVFKPELVFESSGTTGSVNSKHFVKEASLYIQSFLKTFNIFYGDINDWCIIGLLPSYLERQNSSLVYMVNELVSKSGNANSGFYLDDFKKLHDTLLANETAKQPTLLIGVTYALLDFAEQNKMELSFTTVMETGGMKGRREEITREEVHKKIQQQLGIPAVNSEYGMTELLSQAYSSKHGIFTCPPWMKILIRAEDDPFELFAAKNIHTKYVSGAVNIIDLANIYSCSFLATDDIGKLYANDNFEIIGRLDNSDMRGCGLMIL